MTKTDCGVKAPLEELENVVQLAIDCLRAQLVSPEEQQSLDKGVQEALQVVSRVVRTSIIGTSINRTTDYPNYYTNVYLDAGHTLGILRKKAWCISLDHRQYVCGLDYGLCVTYS